MIKVYVIPLKNRSNLVLRWTDETGKTHQRSAGTTVKREAERVAARLEKEIADTGIRKAQSWHCKRTEFFRQHASRLKRSTTAAYVTALNSIEDLMAPDSLAEISNQWLSTYVERAIAEELSPNTIESRLKHLRKFFGWLQENGHLKTIPKTSCPKAERQFRGRPLCGEEFERMLTATCRVVTDERSEDWQFDLKVLWFSGLRIQDAFTLEWDSTSGISIRDLNRRQPVLWIPPTYDKSGQESITPLTPDFVAHLRTRPEDERTGLVCKFLSARMVRFARPTGVSTVISRIGKKANIDSGRSHKGEILYATAHDLRRSFCTRWATKLPAPVLQQMMRHKSLKTTMTYYCHFNAVTIGETIQTAYAQMHDTGILASEEVTQ